MPLTIQCLPRPRQVGRRDPRYVVTGVSGVCESLWAYADDRLPLASLGRVEGRNGIVEGRERSSGSNQTRGPLLDVAADDIENQIDSADVFQRVVVEVDELLRAEVKCRLTVGGASGADDVRTELTCELRHHRPDCAGRAVREDALPRLKAAVLEQSLPRGQARDWQARAHPELDAAPPRRAGVG